jgi:hypothetical protein
MPTARRVGNTVRRAVRRGTSRSSYAPEIFGGDLYSAANFNRPLGSDGNQTGLRPGDRLGLAFDGLGSSSFNTPSATSYGRDSVGTGFGGSTAFSGNTPADSVGSGSFSFNAGRNSQLGGLGSSIGGMTGGPFGAVLGSFAGNALSGNPGTVGASTLGSAIGSLFGGYGATLGSVAGNLYSGNYSGAAVGALGALARAAGLSNPAVATLSFAAPYLYNYFFGQQSNTPNGTVADVGGPGGFRGQGYDGAAGDAPSGGTGGDFAGGDQGWTGESDVDSGGSDGGFYGQGDLDNTGYFGGVDYGGLGGGDSGGFGGSGLDGPGGDFQAVTENPDALRDPGNFGGDFGGFGDSGGGNSSGSGGWNGFDTDSV